MFGRRRLEGAMPLRGELLSLEGLEERAKTLAAGLTLVPASRTGGHDVLPRLDANIRALNAAYRCFADDVHQGVAVPPAAEWLLDNFHLVVSEARAVRHDLPARYYRKLPKLAAREFSGKARVHAMALELIRHGDGRLDAGRLTRFVLAFQTIAPLTIGELPGWLSVTACASDDHKQITLFMVNTRTEPVEVQVDLRDLGEGMEIIAGEVVGDELDESLGRFEPEESARPSYSGIRVALEVCPAPGFFRTRRQPVYSISPSRPHRRHLRAQARQSRSWTG